MTINNSLSSTRQLLDKWAIDHFIVSNHPNGIGLKNMVTFQVRSRREIAILLHKVMDEEEKIVLTALTHPLGVSAVIREIDEDQDTMIFTLTESAGAVSFGEQPMLHEMSLEGIRIFFYAALMPGEFRGRPAFQVAIPKMLMRIQRRRHYRVPTRSGEIIRCEIPVGEAAIEVQVINLSGGGIGVTDMLGQLPLAIGGIHQNCIVHFDGHPLELALELRSIKKASAAEDSAEMRLGYRFFEPDQQDLDTIQNQVDRLEQRKNPSKFR